jgi:2'-5' RNA ligase
MKQPVPGGRGLVVLTPDEVSSVLDRWRHLYDPNYELVPPHITVAYPPFVPEEEWPEAREAMIRCLSQFRPFEIQLRRLGAFSGDSHYLWLKPEDGGHLSRIHTELLARFPHYVPPLPFKYQPHLTIGVFDSQHALRCARRAVREELTPLHFTVTELVYLSPDSRGVWCVCSRVPLGEHANVDGHHSSGIE